MCGRYTLTRTADELVEVFDVPPLGFLHEPRYNIAPGQEVPVLAQDRKGRRMGPLLWGLVPSGTDGPGKGFINARSETVARLPSFRDSIRVRRCLIPADGFYEWKREGDGKVPFWFHEPDRSLFTMAAIWDHWAAPGERERYAFAILTTEAGEGVRDVHHRMPVVVEAADRDVWLDHGAPFGDIANIMAATRSWTRHRVSPKVGSPRNDEPALIEPA